MTYDDKNHIYNVMQSTAFIEVVVNFFLYLLDVRIESSLIT
jgi:hypothetical protein